MYKYKVSVVMAVYNVEPFLREAIDSVIAQDMGFENIQLILVDDGSPDGSGAICDEYAAKYPNNIVVIHKENGGVSSARNAGLDIAEGEYINFLDSDDKFSPDVFRLILDFFEEHGSETDIVSIPLIFFDGQTGGHPLNSKFKNGTRVIDLTDEWETAQLSLASAFVKADCFRTLRFSPALAYAEDAQLVLKILSKKQTLGVVSEAVYHYRKRSLGEASAIQSSGKTLSWYHPYLEHFTEHVIAYYLENLGFLPRFVQNTLMYDLQWRFRQSHVPNDLLNEDEAEAYRQRLFALLKYIDDTVIVTQNSLSIEQKIALLRAKHSDLLPSFMYHSSDKKWLLQFNGTILYDLSKFQTRINFIQLFPDYVQIEGSYLVPDLGLNPPAFCVVSNGTPHHVSDNQYDEIIYTVDRPIAVRKGFIVRIPRIEDTMIFSFMFDYGDFTVPSTNRILGKFCPITYRLAKSYYHQDGYSLFPTRQGFRLAKQSRQQVRKCEFLLCKELLGRKGGRQIKPVLSRLLVHLIRPLVHKNIWLITDKSDRADDNGEAFFLYCLKNKEKANCYPIFAIGKHSADYKRLKKFGPVIPYMSLRHKLCHVLAAHTISAYSHDEISSPFYNYGYFYCDLMQRNKIVFLQHGITKDDVSTGLNRNHKNFSLFVTSTNAEYDSLLECNYGYTDQHVILTGLPRYDRLYDDDQKKITIMPTWRRSLFGTYNPNNSQWSLLPGFKNSQFYQFYSDLLNSEKLHSATEKYGYSLQFLIHPTLFPYMDQFQISPSVKVLGSNAVYRDVFAQSSLILTDYSSVAFDMAYLRKPVLYCHFDTNHYDEGYFNYERDGFGEVCYNLEETVDTIIEYMENDCRLKDIYRSRIDNFYVFNDRNNCQRVYDQIMKLDGGVE